MCRRRRRDKVGIFHGQNATECPSPFRNELYPHSISNCVLVLALVHKIESLAAGYYDGNDNLGIFS